jgi:hypothetical protein
MVAGVLTAVVAHCALFPRFPQLMNECQMQEQAMVRSFRRVPSYGLE